MKLIRFIAAAAIALTATTAMAQGGMGGGQGGQAGAQRQMDAMFQGITLTDAQKASVEKLFTDSRAESTKLREGMEPGTRPTPELREKMTAVTTKRNDAIKALLTDEQKTVFAKNLEDMAAAAAARQRPPR